MRLRLALGLVLGVGTGSSLQCGGAKPLLALGVCTEDSDCVISCKGTGCCSSDCPCGTAITTVERDRISKERFYNCADVKIACRAPRPDACDWHLRHRAVCQAGSCVAEVVPGGAAAEHLPPPMPDRIDAAHPSCGECIAFDRQSCDLYRGWTCDPGVECRMAAPCDPSCCDRPKITPTAEPEPAAPEPLPTTPAVVHADPPKPEPPEPEPPEPEPEPEPPEPEPSKPEPPKPEPPKPEPPPPPSTLDEVVAACVAEHPTTAADVTVRIWSAASGETTRAEVTAGATGKLARCIERLARTLAHSRSGASVTTRRIAIPKPQP